MPVNFVLNQLSNVLVILIYGTLTFDILSGIEYKLRAASIVSIDDLTGKNCKGIGSSD